MIVPEPLLYFCSLSSIPAVSFFSATAPWVGAAFQRASLGVSGLAASFE